jgi:hypothetical protein
MLKNKFVKIGIVIAGYIIALIVAFVAVYIRELATQGTDAQASQGMFAFGETILFLVVLGVLALVPTALAFYFLRPLEKLWTGFAVLCLVFSIMGWIVLLANRLMEATVGYTSNPFAAFLSLAAVLSIFGTPVFAVCFLILAIIAPSGRSRFLLLISAGCQILAALYMFVNFLLFQRFF